MTQRRVPEPEPDTSGLVQMGRKHYNNNQIYTGSDMVVNALGSGGGFNQYQAYEQGGTVYTPVLYKYSTNPSAFPQNTPISAMSPPTITPQGKFPNSLFITAFFSDPTTTTEFTVEVGMDAGTYLPGNPYATSVLLSPSTTLQPGGSFYQSLTIQPGDDGGFLLESEAYPANLDTAGGRTGGLPWYATQDTTLGVLNIRTPNGGTPTASAATGFFSIQFKYFSATYYTPNQL